MVVAWPSKACNIPTCPLDPTERSSYPIGLGTVFVALDMASSGGLRAFVKSKNPDRNKHQNPGVLLAISGPNIANYKYIGVEHLE
jgi:hypothetical protein